ncbi:hypothetical protein D046_4850B, partial [Vibrio parahaemolyticus V-223/04]
NHLRHKPKQPPSQKKSQKRKRISLNLCNWRCSLLNTMKPFVVIVA